MSLPRSPLRGWCSLFLSAAALSAFAQNPPKNPPKKEDGWVYHQDEQAGVRVQTRELILHPRAAPRPALKHRLMLDEFERTPGNAALFYLKATGFFEQESARERISQHRKEQLKRVQKEGLEYGQLPPYVWLNTAPEDLPVEEVKKYLQWLSFQPQFIREGAKRSHFDMNRNFREVDDPIAYLLPEIQGFRELARMQSLRCRLAIAEGRLDDAVEITGQQFAVAAHLGDDDFLVSNLVGIAIAHIAWNDALYLVQHPQAPNLYWALAAMPSPLVSQRRAMATERQFLYQQLKVLREVSERPRPAGYWQDFVDRLAPQLGYLGSELGLSPTENNPEAVRAAIVAFVAAAYPGAKKYLLEEQKLPPGQVEAYPTAQVVFLAMVRFHDHWRDEMFKWMHLPYWQARTKMTSQNLSKNLRVEAQRCGWCAMPTQTLLPAVLAARTAEARSVQVLALLQTVEAVRMYAAEHGGGLPPSLEALSVPAPIEPLTGQPIQYELLREQAVLTGHAMPGLRYRLVLKIAQ